MHPVMRGKMERWTYGGEDGGEHVEDDAHDGVQVLDGKQVGEEHVCVHVPSQR